MGQVTVPQMCAFISSLIRCRETTRPHDVSHRLLSLYCFTALCFNNACSAYEYV